MKLNTEIESAYLFVVLLALVCLVARWAERSEDAIATPAPPTSSDQGSAGAVATVIRGEKLDLNRIRAGELRLLPGVGRKTAEEVVQYRERHGSFSSVEELVAVKGIGSKTVARLMGWLEVR
jgi:competence protein ComEA